MFWDWKFGETFVPDVLQFRGAGVLNPGQLLCNWIGHKPPNISNIPALRGQEVKSCVRSRGTAPDGAFGALQILFLGAEWVFSYALLYLLPRGVEGANNSPLLAARESHLTLTPVRLDIHSFQRCGSVPLFQWRSSRSTNCNLRACSAALFF